MKINTQLRVAGLKQKLVRLFDVSAVKIRSIEKTWNPARGAPVFTRAGKYTTRGWTEWTQGFQFGSALLQFDATGDKEFLEIGREQTVRVMAPHVSHVGVHDHGFNNISTYGNLRRLLLEGKIPFNEHEKNFYELALKVSGAVQAARWTKTAEGGGFIYSFNGPHSLFIDTMRSLRSLAVAHQLGHVLTGEHDQRISLLGRLIDHAETTATHGIYYGRGRDAYDVRGRTAHESIFNLNDGSYRCPNSQQGYSPFSTWTRGLAWAICGFAEQIEFLQSVSGDEVAAAVVPPALLQSNDQAGLPRSPRGGRWPRRSQADLATRLRRLRTMLLDAATATADFYLENSCADGVPMWDTGAPNLHRLGDYLNRAADPYNKWEPVDSSA